MDVWGGRGIWLAFVKDHSGCCVDKEWGWGRDGDVSQELTVLVLNFPIHPFPQSITHSQHFLLCVTGEKGDGITWEIRASCGDKRAGSRAQWKCLIGSWRFGSGAGREDRILEV